MGLGLAPGLGIAAGLGVAAALGAGLGSAVGDGATLEVGPGVEGLAPGVAVAGSAERDGRGLGGSEARDVVLGLGTSEGGAAVHAATAPVSRTSTVERRIVIVGVSVRQA